MSLACKPWLIERAAIEGAWPAVKHMVEAALSDSLGRLDADDVLELLRDGGMQLWAMVTADGEPEVVAVLVTEIIDYPRKRVLDLALMGGARMDLWLSALPVLEQWAAQQGIHQLQIHGRRGWARATGYPERGAVLVKEIGGDNG